MLVGKSAEKNLRCRSVKC